MKLKDTSRNVRDKFRKAKHKVSRTIRPAFWKKVIITFSPKNYSELSEKSPKSGLNYILALLFASFIIMGIIAVPKIIQMPGYIESELSKFSELRINISAETKEPVMLTESDPQIIIDTSSDDREMGKEKFLITDSYLFYRPFGMERSYNLSEFSDITSKKPEISRLLTFAAILLVPTVLITAYIMFFVKYIITILIASLLLFAAVRMLKRDLSLKKSLLTCMFASTPMILLEIIFIPFNSKYLIPLFQIMGMNFYLITILAFALLAGFSSAFALKKPRGKDQDEYLTVEKVEWDF